jgi:hypothetical protein
MVRRRLFKAPDSKDLHYVAKRSNYSEVSFIPIDSVATSQLEIFHADLDRQRFFHRFFTFYRTCSNLKAGTSNSNTDHQTYRKTSSRNRSSVHNPPSLLAPENSC